MPCNTRTTKTMLVSLAHHGIFEDVEADLAVIILTHRMFKAIVFVAIHLLTSFLIKDRSTVQMSQTLALPFYRCVGACMKHGKSNDLLRDGVILYTVLVSFSATPVRHV